MADDIVVLREYGNEFDARFAATILEANVRREFAVKLIGRAADARERFCAISREEKLKHPGVVAV